MKNVSGIFLASSVMILWMTSMVHAQQANVSVLTGPSGQVIGTFNPSVIQLPGNVASLSQITNMGNTPMGPSQFTMTPNGEISIDAIPNTAPTVGPVAMPPTGTAISNGAGSNSTQSAVTANSAFTPVNNVSTVGASAIKVINTGFDIGLSSNFNSNVQTLNSNAAVNAVSNTAINTAIKVINTPTVNNDLPMD